MKEKEILYFLSDFEFAAFYLWFYKKVNLRAIASSLNTDISHAKRILAGARNKIYDKIAEERIKRNENPR